MKKIIIISLVILSIVASALLVFDNSETPSTNNEGLKKPAIVFSGPSALLITI